MIRTALTEVASWEHLVPVVVAVGLVVVLPLVLLVSGLWFRRRRLAEEADMAAMETIPWSAIAAVLARSADPDAPEPTALSEARWRAVAARMAQLMLCEGDERLAVLEQVNDLMEPVQDSRLDAVEYLAGAFAELLADQVASCASGGPDFDVVAAMKTLADDADVALLKVQLSGDVEMT